MQREGASAMLVCCFPVSWKVKYRGTRRGIVWRGQVHAVCQYFQIKKEKTSGKGDGSQLQSHRAQTVVDTKTDPDPDPDGPS